LAAASWAEEEAVEDEQDKFAAHPPVRPGDLRQQRDLRRQQMDDTQGGVPGKGGHREQALDRR
jgi:hypothetical protein